MSTRSSRLYGPELPRHACTPGSCIPRPKPRRYSVASACDHLICWCLRLLPVPHHAWRFSPSVPSTSGATEPRPFRPPDPPSWQPFVLLESVRRRESRPVRRVDAPLSWMPTHRRAMALSIATRHSVCRRTTRNLAACGSSLSRDTNCGLLTSQGGKRVFHPALLGAAGGDPEGLRSPAVRTFITTRRAREPTSSRPVRSGHVAPGIQHRIGADAPCNPFLDIRPLIACSCGGFAPPMRGPSQQ
jgi:hypothetical protein